MNKTFVCITSALMIVNWGYCMQDGLQKENRIFSSNAYYHDQELRHRVAHMEQGDSSDNAEQIELTIGYNEKMDNDCKKLQRRCKQTCCCVIGVGSLVFIARYVFNKLNSLFCIFCLPVSYR